MRQSTAASRRAQQQSRRQPRVQGKRQQQRQVVPFAAAPDGFAALMEDQWERQLETGAIGALLPLIPDTWEEW